MKAVAMNGRVLGLQNICMDWGNKRMHFYFAGQNKRCAKFESRLVTMVLRGARVIFGWSVIVPGEHVSRVHWDSLGGSGTMGLSRHNTEYRH